MVPPWSIAIFYLHTVVRKRKDATILKSAQKKQKEKTKILEKYFPFYYCLIKGIFLVQGKVKGIRGLEEINKRKYVLFGKCIKCFAYLKK